ncbi:MAG TPA: DUF4982 domain-containing protein, partial [Paludibacter sp.]|nr:DUF4982 domain-containing protein [Paludibacter sp.]
KAQLLLNGKVVGNLKEYDNKTGIIYWDIPYQDGKLEVEGFDKEGKKIASNFIRSSKRPYALQVNEKLVTINKKNGITQIVVQVVDEEGVPVMLADNNVTCQIKGPVKLLGLEASNNEDMSDYTDNHQRVYNGQILAYFKATEANGQAKIRFSSPLLKPVEVTIDIK